MPALNPRHKPCRGHLKEQVVMLENSKDALFYSLKWDEANSVSRANLGGGKGGEATHQGCFSMDN
jgi:hypothetical protein